MNEKGFREIEELLPGEDKNNIIIGSPDNELRLTCKNRVFWNGKLVAKGEEGKYIVDGLKLIFKDGGFANIRSAMIEDAVRVLNEAIDADRQAMENLFSKRVLCNKKFADHPTIQVGGLGDGRTDFSVLGLINGLFGVDKDGWGAIAALYDLKCSCEHTPKGSRTGEICPVCGHVIELGRLIEFHDNGRQVRQP